MILPAGAAPEARLLLASRALKIAYDLALWRAFRKLRPEA